MIPVDITSESPRTGTSDEVTYWLFVDSMANLIGDISGDYQSINDESTFDWQERKRQRQTE